MCKRVKENKPEDAECKAVFNEDKVCTSCPAVPVPNGPATPPQAVDMPKPKCQAVQNSCAAVQDKNERTCCMCKRVKENKPEDAECKAVFNEDKVCKTCGHLANEKSLCSKELRTKAKQGDAIWCKCSATGKQTDESGCGAKEKKDLNCTWNASVSVCEPKTEEMY